jgi:hypothetical protein
VAAQRAARCGALAGRRLRSCSDGDPHR